MKLEKQTTPKMADVIAKCDNVYPLICILCFTATVISIIMFVEYHTLLKCCERNQRQKANKIGVTINWLALLGTLWSMIKILIVLYMLC